MGVSKSIAPLNRRGAGVGLCDPRELDVVKLEVEAGDELEQDLFLFRAMMRNIYSIDKMMRQVQIQMRRIAEGSNVCCEGQ